MNCKSCGKEMSDDMHSCPSCGMFIETEDEKKNQEILQYVEKNTEYFGKEFAKIQQSQKPKFNWAAFWVTMPYCIYRKQYDVIKKYLLIPFCLNILLNVVWSIYLLLSIDSMNLITFHNASFNYQLITSAVGIWLLIVSILVGKNFNFLYFKKLQELYEVRMNNEKQTGVSVKNVIIFLVLISVVIGFFSMVENYSLDKTVERIEAEVLHSSEGMNENILMKNEMGIMICMTESDKTKS